MTHISLPKHTTLSQISNRVRTKPTPFAMSQDGRDHQGATSNNEGNTLPAINSDSMSSGENNNGSGSKTGSLVNAGTDKGKGVVKKEEEGGGSKGKSSADVVVAADGRTGGDGRRGDRVHHNVTERERRKRMREMLSDLQALLPSLPDKTDNATMVGVAIDYIKSLEVTVADLEKRKSEMKLARGRRGAADAGPSSSSGPPATATAPTQTVLPIIAHDAMPPAGAVTAAPALAPAGLQTWSGPTVVLSVSGDDAYINVCAARRPGVMTMVAAAVLEKHRMELITAEVASDDSRSMLMIHARVNGAISQFGDNMASEEIYKLAASEIMVQLSN